MAGSGQRVPGFSRWATAACSALRGSSPPTFPVTTLQTLACQADWFPEGRQRLRLLAPGPSCTTHLESYLLNPEICFSCDNKCCGRNKILSGENQVQHGGLGMRAWAQGRQQVEEGRVCFFFKCLMLAPPPIYLPTLLSSVSHLCIIYLSSTSPVIHLCPCHLSVHLLSTVH